MDRWKSRGGKSQRREKVRRERVGTKKIKVREKVEVSRNIGFCSKSRLAKEAGAEPSGQMGNEKLHAAPAHFEAKMRKTPQVRNTFGSWHVQKVYAVVAPSTFRSQNAQNTSAPEHFWKLRCSKSVRCCGAKHVSNSKCAKDRSPGTLLEVEMFKKCTPLWREASFEVKMSKTRQLRNAFGSWDVQKMHATVAQSTFRLQNVQNTSAPEHFLEVEMFKKRTPLWRKTNFEVKIPKTPHARPLLEVEMFEKRTPLWREAHFEVKMLDTFRRRFAGARDSEPCQKWAKREGFVAIATTMAGVGRLKVCKDAKSQIFRFAKIFFYDRRSTSYDLASLFRSRRNTLDKCRSKNAKRSGVRGGQLCTQLSISEGGLAEWLCLWCC